MLYTTSLLSLKVFFEGRKLVLMPCPLACFLDILQQNDQVLGSEKKKPVLFCVIFIHGWYDSLQIDMGSPWHND